MPEEMNRAGHLFARIDGKRGKKLLLIGHLDTVFEADSPFQTFERDGDFAYAPGGNDMKGGDVVILFALRALHELNLIKDAGIIVALTGDEERTGKPLSISRKDLIEAAKESDIALGFETATGFNNATIARRGASGWKVETAGKRAHSSGSLVTVQVPVQFLNCREYSINFMRKFEEKNISPSIRAIFWVEHLSTMKT